MIGVYEEYEFPTNGIGFLLVWENDLTYLIELMTRTVLGDCNDIEGYIRITKKDVESVKMNVIEEFHSANEGLNVYIDAVTDLMNLLRKMRSDRKYFIWIDKSDKG